MKWLVKEVNDCTEANDICKKIEKKGGETRIFMSKRTPKDNYIYKVIAKFGGKAND